MKGTQLRMTAAQLNIDCSYHEMKELLEACENQKKAEEACIVIKNLHRREQVKRRRTTFVVLVVIFVLLALRMIGRSNNTSGHILPTLMMFLVPIIIVAIYGRKLALVTRYEKLSIVGTLICFTFHVIPILLAIYLWTGHAGMLAATLLYQGHNYAHFWNTFLLIISVVPAMVMMICLYFLFTRGTAYYTLFCIWYTTFCYVLNYRVINSRVSEMAVYNNFLNWNFQGYLIGCAVVAIGGVLCYYYPNRER